MYILFFGSLIFNMVDEPVDSPAHNFSPMLTDLNALIKPQTGEKREVGEFDFGKIVDANLLVWLFSHTAVYRVFTQNGAKHIVPSEQQFYRWKHLVDERCQRRVVEADVK